MNKANDSAIVAVASDACVDVMSILNSSSPGRCATPTNEDVNIQGKHGHSKIPLICKYECGNTCTIKIGVLNGGLRDIFKMQDTPNNPCTS